MAEAWALRRALLETLLESRYGEHYVSRRDIMRLIAQVSEDPQGAVRRLRGTERAMFNRKIQQLELFP